MMHSMGELDCVLSRMKSGRCADSDGKCSSMQALR